MEAKKTTVKDIATELNLSVGTVSRALSNKNGVKAETRRLVLDKAKSMGYRMNRLAQSMARKPIMLGIVIPKVWPYHYGMLELGMKHELSELIDYNISGTFRYVSGLHEPGEVETAIDSLIAKKADLVILCPSFDKAYERGLLKLNRVGIPAILLGTEIEAGERVSCVSTDCRLSGNMAGEFMGHIISPQKRCAVLIGNKDMQEHREKVEGFLEWLPERVGYAGAYETQDEPELAYRTTQKILKEHDDLGGIYVATGNSIAVCECLEEERKAGKIRLVVTDIFREIKEKANRGMINGVIYQNQLRQGSKAIRQAFDYITRGKCGGRVTITPQLVLKSNIEYFLD